MCIFSIFATPSIILRSAGSVGVALLMWIAGASIAAAGTAVYIELGSVSIILYYLSFSHNQAVGHAKKRRGEELPRVYV